MTVDLNADVGEQPVGRSDLSGITPIAPEDEALLGVVTSVSIACGFHAGSPGLMRQTLTLARGRGVAVGAHPGLPDRAGFGRDERPVSPLEIEDLVTYQTGALAAMARAQGVRLQHVKVHGALYNMAARDASLAEAIARATAAVDASLILFGLSGSELIAAGRRAGLRTASEVFADRAYRADGTLLPRSEPGSVLTASDVVVARAVMMARSGAVIAVDGTRVPLEVETMCVHGDTPGAARLAARIRWALEQAGIEVIAPGRGPQRPGS